MSRWLDSLGKWQKGFGPFCRFHQLARKGNGMNKTTAMGIAASAALAATLGLSACGGQPANSSSSAASSSSASASSSASTSSSSADATEDDNKIVDWDGALTDGTTVSYIESKDLKNAALSVTPAGSSEMKTWMGASTVVEEDGQVKQTITDDSTKESIVITWASLTKEGAVEIEIEGYGKGAVVPLTMADYKKIGKLQEALDKAKNAVDWEGSLADGTLVSYMENEDATQAALSITPAGTSQTKTWMGAASSTPENGKVTITDDATKETITFTVVNFTEDAVFEIDIEDYGKASLVPVTADDYQKIAELQSTLNKK